MTAWANGECSTFCDSSAADITGDSVKAMMPETITAPASVKANSLNRMPVTPPSKPIGA